MITNKALIDEILNGIELSFLDYKFINAMIYFKTTKEKREVLSKYRDIYFETYNQTPLEHQKDNRGRFRANCWLRELVE